MQPTGGYIISGGLAGKDRLNILAAVLHGYTQQLLLANGLATGASFLDVGCGGGNVTAIDFDEELIALDQKDAAQQGIKNIAYQTMSAYDLSFANEFDVVYSRFLLSHLTEPLKVLSNMLAGARPGGKIIVEDIDFSGHFCYPESEAFNRYVNLFSATARQRGQNPDIGPSLLSLFKEAAISDVEFDVIQPAFNQGDGKLMAYITMGRIKDAVVNEGLANEQEVTDILQQLEEFTTNVNTIISLPRIFRVWGTKR
jgi:SAM-dependent methyltransferase